MSKNSSLSATPDTLQPHNVDAEEALLGSLLIDSDAIMRVATFIDEKDFFVERNGWIFSAIRDLHEKREPSDLVTLSDELERRNQLYEIGGPAHLTSLINATPTSIHAEFYGRIIERTALLRRLIDAAGKIARMAYEDQNATDEVVDRAEELIFGVSARRSERDLRPISQIIDKYYDRLDYLHKHKGEVVGIPTSLTDLDKMLGGLQRSDMIVMAGRPGMGKCVTADTQLIDPNSGDLITIETLVHRRQADILTLNNDYKLQHTTASDFVNDGVKPVYQVTTALGRTIKVTLTHPFLTINGWRSLGELNEGDYIAVPRIIPVFGHYDAPEHEVKVLAYLLADGCVNGSCPQFTNSNPRLREDFALAAQQFPGTKTSLRDSQGKRTPTVHVTGDLDFIKIGRADFAQQLNRAMQQANLSQAKLAKKLGVSSGLVAQWSLGHCVPSAPIFELLCNELQLPSDNMAIHGLPAISKNGLNSLTVWLQEQDVWGKVAATKEIPNNVYRYTRPKLALFLNRLFACDGSLYIQLGKQAAISYSTVSLKLAHGVQHLLLRFGIIAKLRHRQIKYNGDSRPAYELRITGTPNLKLFVEQIGTFGKETALTKIQDYIQQTVSNPNTDIIPLEIWNYITQAKGKRTWRELYNDMGLPSSANIHVGQRAPSRDRLLAIGNAIGSKQLINLAQSDIYWDKIVKIESKGEQQVYDLTVADTHNFVADDMLVHNTSLALSVALQAARRWDKRVAIFSLEMSDEQLVQRLIAAETGIDIQRLRLGDITEEEWPLLTKVCSTLSNIPIFIDDTAAISAYDLRTKARRLHAEHGLDLMIVDYLQLMQGDMRSENRQQEISFISRSVKTLARELNIPILALSQLSRQVESRADKRPMLSDLRESGSIEQDSDVVLFIYRDEVYNEDSEFPNIAEIIIAKHRSGPTGKVSVFFKKQVAQFTDLDITRQPLDY